MHRKNDFTTSSLGAKTSNDGFGSSFGVPVQYCRFKTPMLYWPSIPTSTKAVSELLMSFAGTWVLPPSARRLACSRHLQRDQVPRSQHSITPGKEWGSDGEEALDGNVIAASVFARGVLVSFVRWEGRVGAQYYVETPAQKRNENDGASHREQVRGAGEYSEADDECRSPGWWVRCVQPCQDERGQSDRQNACPEVCGGQPAIRYRWIVLQAEAVEAKCSCEKAYRVPDQGVSRAGGLFLRRFEEQHDCGAEAREQPRSVEGKSDGAGCGENDQAERCCVQTDAHLGTGLPHASMKRPLHHRALIA